MFRAFHIIWFESELNSRWRVHLIIGVRQAVLHVVVVEVVGEEGGGVAAAQERGPRQVSELGQCDLPLLPWLTVLTVVLTVLTTLHYTCNSIIVSIELV